MAWLDAFVLGVMLVCFVVGAWRGLVSEVFALIGWGVGFFAAHLFGEPVGEMLKPWVSDVTLRWLGGCAIVVVFVLILSALLRWLLRALVNATGLGPIDRVLGASFGLAKGVAIVLLGAVLAGLTVLPREAGWQEAHMAMPLETAVMAIKPKLPEGLAKRLRYR